MRQRNAAARKCMELPMTPMIDIVFQLLVFFIMTFKVVSAEGDFNVRMPLARQGSAVSEEHLPTLQLRLEAEADGSLAKLVLNNEQLPSMQVLRAKVVSLLGNDRGPNSLAAEMEVEIDADYGLDYLHVVEAITAVSGYVDPNTGTLVDLVDKIKFASPRRAS